MRCVDQAKKLPVFVPCIILAFLLAGAPRARAAGLFCDYADQGFTFSVPDGWVESPGGEVERLQKRIQSQQGGKPVQCVGAYQPADHGTTLQYPYLLVEVIPYSNNVTYAQFTEEEIKHMAASISGMDLKKIQSASPGLVFSLEGSPTYQVNPPGFQWNLATDTPADGKIHVQLFCRLGGDRLAQLCIYTRENDLGTAQQMSQIISQTFSFKQGRGATLKVTESIGESALKWAIIGAVVGAIGYAFKRGRSGPTALDEPKQGL